MKYLCYGNMLNIMLNDGISRLSSDKNILNGVQYQLFTKE